MYSANDHHLRPASAASRLLGLLILVAAAAGVVVFVLPEAGTDEPRTVLPGKSKNDSDKRTPGDVHAPKEAPNTDTTNAMKDRLKAWGKAISPNESPSITAQHYLAAIEAKTFDFDPPKNQPQHPDLVFALRFRSLQAARPGDEKKPAATFEERVSKMLTLLGVTKVDDLKSQELLPRLVRETDYQSWFQDWAKTALGTKRPAGAAFPLDAAAPEEARAFALQFVNSTAADSDMKDDVQKLASQLNQWRVQGIHKQDAEKRPGFVAIVYLYFVSRGHIPDADLESKDWHAAFLLRFPKTPEGVEADLSNKDSLEKALGRLVRALDESPREALGGQVKLLGGTALNYADWVAEARKDAENAKYKEYRDNDSLLPKEVVSFAERFRVKK